VPPLPPHLRFPQPFAFSSDDVAVVAGAVEQGSE
jgi:hypothetical protein